MRRRALGVIDRDAVYRRTQELLAQVGLKESPDTLITDLGVGKQQLVEIAKALSKRVKLLILDEPTASLNEADSQALLDRLVTFRDQGISSILITHKLNEVARVADRITVLRDGRTVDSIDCRAEPVLEDRIIKSMVNRDMAHRFPERTPKIGEPVLTVRNWSVYHPLHLDRQVIKNVDFEVRRGEVVGIAGLMGAGRTEFAMSLFGRAWGTRISGQVQLEGRDVDLSSVPAAIDAGLAYVTEDRKQLGLILADDVRKNITLASLRQVAPNGVIDDIAELKAASGYRSRMRIRSSDVYQEVGQLSGGNQQKVVLSKWLMTDPKVLILDEPTRGIDVGAKYEIYTIINELAAGRPRCRGDLLGDAGAARHLRPDLRHERRRLRRRVRRPRGHAGKDHARHHAQRSHYQSTRRPPDAGGRSLTMTDKTVSLPEPKAHGSFIKNNLRSYGMLLSLFVIMLFFQIMTDGTLLQPLNLTNLVLQNSYIVIMALGMLLVIVTGHIDLSVGSVSGFVGAVAAVLMVQYHVNFPLAVIACLVVGAVIGAAQGYWVAYFGIPSFIVTLAGMLVFKGLALALLQGQSVGPFPGTFQKLSSGFIPELFPSAGTLYPTSLAIGALLTLALVYASVKGRSRELSHGIEVEPYAVFVAKNAILAGAILYFTYLIASHRGLPNVLVIMTVLIALYGFMTRRTVVGRQIYAVGGNAKAAKLSGIKAERLVFLTFVNMGVLAALAGLVFAARLNTATPKAGLGFELDVIAACFIGGASAYGGVGRVGGAVIGAMIMGVMNNGMSILGVGIDYQQVIKGLVLLGAVCIDVYNQRR